MTLKELREKLREKTASLSALKTKALGEGSTDADLKAWNDALDEIDRLSKQIDTLMREEKALSEVTGRDANTETETSTRSNPQVKEKLTVEKKLGLIVQGMVKTKRGEATSVHDHINKAGYGQFAEEFHGEQIKALNTTTGANGGTLIPPNFNQEITDLLYPTTAFLRLNPMPIPMPNGSYEEPAGATGASASWTAEMQPAVASEPTFRTIKMSAKALTALVPMTRNFMNFTLASSVSWVQRNMLTVMALETDKGLLRGDGTQTAPLGLYKIPGVGQALAATYAPGTTPTLAQIDALAAKLLLSLTTNNIPTGSARWVMTEGVRTYLANVRNNMGVQVWPNIEGDKPTWKGYPVLVTTNLPSNLGGSGNASELALVAGDFVMHADVGSMEMLFSQEGTVIINGQVYSGIQHGMGFLVAVSQTDVNLRYLKAVAVAPDCQWGS